MLHPDAHRSADRVDVRRDGGSPARSTARLLPVRNSDLLTGAGDASAGARGVPLIQCAHAAVGGLLGPPSARHGRADGPQHLFGVLLGAAAGACSEAAGRTVAARGAPTLS